MLFKHETTTNIIHVSVCVVGTKSKHDTDANLYGTLVKRQRLHRHKHTTSQTICSKNL